MKPEPGIQETPPVGSLADKCERALKSMPELVVSAALEIFAVNMFKTGRGYVATHVLQGMLANKDYKPPRESGEAVADAYARRAADYADALIADTSIDLRSASTKPLAMKWAQAPGGEPASYNTGVMYARAASAPLFAAMVNRAPLPGVKQGGPWWLLPDGEARICNELLRQERWAMQTEPLGAFWNCVLGVENVPQPAVVAWHGIEDTTERLRLMRRWLQVHA